MPKYISMPFKEFIETSTDLRRDLGLDSIDIMMEVIKSKIYKKRGATFFYDVTRKLGLLDFTQYRSKSSSF